ncbi:MAG: 3-deoxy-8-phosphooctulonate synthase [Gemmatimonadota bacterium]|nr:3-deoxy-8-phosphooctulonate synthase [Gemmatimonadota bacterium]
MRARRARPPASDTFTPTTDAMFFPRDALFLIAGPCVLESDALNLRVAEHLARLAERVPGGIIYKASFDKANRSNAGAARGPGIDDGLAALARVREATGLPLLTDVHLPEQCAEAAEVVDVLQIPAFLCRQTDLLLAAGATGRAVNVKKGQWMHPEGMRGAAAKVREGFETRHSALGVSTAELAVTERGSFFGYGDLVVDMRSFTRMRAACDAPVIFDATHSVQQPGRSEGGSSGGAREFIPALTLAAMGAGADGIFMETHPDPANAPSDGPNMVPLGELDQLILRAVDAWHVRRK